MAVHWGGRGPGHMSRNSAPNHAPPPASGKVLLENNTDAILLEDGTGTLQLEG